MRKFTSLLLLGFALGSFAQTPGGVSGSELWFKTAPLNSDLQGYWKSHATLTLLATQDLPTFGYNMIDPLKSWCWGSILFYPFKISRFS